MFSPCCLCTQWLIFYYGCVINAQLFEGLVDAVLPVCGVRACISFRSNSLEYLQLQCVVSIWLNAFLCAEWVIFYMIYYGCVINADVLEGLLAVVVTVCMEWMGVYHSEATVVWNTVVCPFTNCGSSLSPQPKCLFHQVPFTPGLSCVLKGCLWLAIGNKSMAWICTHISWWSTI